MRKVFICYRRAAAQYAAGALGRGLRERLGDEQVFRDREDMQGGASWREQVLHAISGQSALLVLIDRDWADPRQPAGQRRLDGPADPIRMEVRDGLADGATIIPVLLESAIMPDEADLPPDIRVLGGIHALQLRDTDWSQDFDRICQRLEGAGFKPVTPRAAPVKEPGPSRAALFKLIGSYLLGGLCLLSFAGTSDDERAAYTGLTFFGVVAVVLAGFAYRDYRKRGPHRPWPAIGALVLGALVTVGCAVGAVVSPPGPAVAPTPALVPATVSPSVAPAPGAPS
jgi:hypothetical protein